MAKAKTFSLRLIGGGRRQAFDVGGVVEKPVAFRLDQSRIVLLETLEASPTGRGDVRFPVRPPQRLLPASPDRAGGSAAPRRGAQLRRPG